MQYGVRVARNPMDEALYNVTRHDQTWCARVSPTATYKVDGTLLYLTQPDNNAEAIPANGYIMNQLGGVPAMCRRRIFHCDHVSHCHDGL